MGQVNGLSVVNLGDYAFAHPARITARTGMGTEVEVETHGDREQEAMDALLALIADKFGEGE